MTRKSISAEDFLQRIIRHRAWLEAGAREDDPERLTLIGVQVSTVRLENADLSSAELIRCDLSGSVFIDCDLGGAMLDGALLRGCTFEACRLRKAELPDADCTGSHFTHCDLTRADFTRAIFADADLSGSDLGWAWFVDTDLSGTGLDDVNLDGARLVRARFTSGRRFRLQVTQRTMIEAIVIDNMPPRSGEEALVPLRL